MDKDLISELQDQLYLDLGFIKKKNAKGKIIYVPWLDLTPKKMYGSPNNNNFITEFQISNKITKNKINLINIDFNIAYKTYSLVLSRKFGEKITQISKAEGIPRNEIQQVLRREILPTLSGQASPNPYIDPNIILEKIKNSYGGEQTLDAESYNLTHNDNSGYWELVLLLREVHWNATSSQLIKKVKINFDAIKTKFISIDLFNNHEDGNPIHSILLSGEWSNPEKLKEMINKEIVKYSDIKEKIVPKVVPNPLKEVSSAKDTKTKEKTKEPEKIEVKKEKPNLIDDNLELIYKINLPPESISKIQTTKLFPEDIINNRVSLFEVDLKELINKIHEIITILIYPLARYNIFEMNYTIDFIIPFSIQIMIKSINSNILNGNISYFENNKKIPAKMIYSSLILNDPLNSLFSLLLQIKDSITKTNLEEIHGKFNSEIPTNQIYPEEYSFLIYQKLEAIKSFIESCFTNQINISADPVKFVI